MKAFKLGRIIKEKVGQTMGADCIKRKNQYWWVGDLVVDCGEEAEIQKYKIQKYKIQKYLIIKIIIKRWWIPINLCSFGHNQRLSARSINIQGNKYTFNWTIMWLLESVIQLKQFTLLTKKRTKCVEFDGLRECAMLFDLQIGWFTFVDIL